VHISNVFIDTQAFDRLMLDFESAPLKQLKRLANEEKFRVILSSVVCKEIESHIASNTNEALSALDKFQKKARPFKSLGSQYEPFFATYDVEAATELALGVWSEFLRESNALVISPKSVDLEEIVDAYFSGTPPFGEKKKKTEFPDAISLGSLLSLLKAEEQQAYVIGEDGDTKAWCEANSSYVVSVDSVRSFLDIYNKEEQPELTASVTSNIDDHLEEITGFLKQCFSEIMFHYEPNYEAEAELLSIEEFEIGEPEIIEVDVYGSTVSVQARVAFTVNITGPNFDTAIWDSEDKEYIFIDSFNSDVSYEEHYEVSFKLESPYSSNVLGEISEVEFDGSSDSITLYDEDEWPYK